ncbi:MAG: tetratricopeptide repeat protein [Myxococcota bacterium]|nr:tetratricopeptide repeat protein [Myxococcota bacterium]
MTPCGWLQKYRDQALNPVEQRDFETHLATCRSCRVEVALWEDMTREISAYAMEVTQDQTEWHEATRLALVARAQHHRPGRVHWFGGSVRWAAAAALGLSILAMGYLTFRTADPDQDTPPRSAETGQVQYTVFSKEGSTRSYVPATKDSAISAAENQRVFARIHRDSMGLLGGSTVNIVHISPDICRFRLVRGTAAWSVDPSRKNREFIVETQGGTVRVKGTRFLTTAPSEHRLEVAVTEGVVEVSTPLGDTRQGTAGKRLIIQGDQITIEAVSPKNRRMLDRLLTERQEKEQPGLADQAEKTDTPEVRPAEDAGPPDQRQQPDDQVPEKEIRQIQSTPTGSIRLWRKWIIDGHFTKAASDLKRHLKKHPRDAEAWSLLADCQRKAGNWKEAVTALNRVIGLVPPKAANPARYRAGVILQDNVGDHRRAIEMFEKYLRSENTSLTLRGKAMMRLALSQRALGELNAARKTLRTIAQEYKGTDLSNKATQLLSEMN